VGARSFYARSIFERVMHLDIDRFCHCIGEERRATADPGPKTRLNSAKDIPRPPRSANIRTSYAHAIISTTGAKILQRKKTTFLHSIYHLHTRGLAVLVWYHSYPSSQTPFAQTSIKSDKREKESYKKQTRTKEILFYPLNAQQHKHTEPAQNVSSSDSTVCFQGPVCGSLGFG
jgi:hypothetical protein